MRRIGFLVNPIAGLGGRVGLKGTDGVEEEALRRGATPVAPGRAREALRAFVPMRTSQDVHWLTCDPPMGADVLRDIGVGEDRIEVLHEPPERTSPEDTKRAARAFADGHADLILFCGGDGTARDLLDAIDARVPVLGIPAGVKMHSAVFAVNPEAAAQILDRFVAGALPTGQAEVLDLDEERYRRGEWNVRLYGMARTPQEPNLVQTGKMMVQEVADEALLEEMAAYLGELMEESPESVFLFGPGGTTAALRDHLGLPSTLLGIDAVVNRKRVAADLDETGIRRVLENHPKAKLVLSPIGAQGFILGRGNLQLSPDVLHRIGVENVLVVATPSKLRATPRLRVDTGEPALDRAFAEKEYLRVVIGYRTLKLHPIDAPVGGAEARSK